MKFFNRYVMAYAAITFTLTLTAYFVLSRAQSWLAVAVAVIYPLSLVAALIMLKRRDDYQGFFGFNYHLTTYLVCVGVPLLLRAYGWPQDLSFVPGMAATWGIGITIHLIIFLILSRKRKLKSFDKREIFR